MKSNMKKPKGLFLVALICLSFVAGGVTAYFFKRIVINKELYNPPIEITHDGLSMSDILENPYTLKYGLYENVFISAGSDIYFNVYEDTPEISYSSGVDYLYNLTIQYNSQFSNLEITTYPHENGSMSLYYDFGNYKSVVKQGAELFNVINVHIIAITDSYFDVYSERTSIFDNITNLETPFNTKYLMTNNEWVFKWIGRNESGTKYDVMYPTASVDDYLYFLVSTSLTKKNIQVTSEKIQTSGYHYIGLHNMDFDQYSAQHTVNTWLWNELEYNTTYYIVITLEPRSYTSYWLLYDCPSPFTLQLL